MAKPYDEARAAAIAAGIPETEITAADLEFYGYEVGDPVKDFNPAVAVDDNRLKSDLVILDAEAKSNRWTATGLAALKRVGSAAMKRFLPIIPMLMLVLLCSGCSSAAAQRATDAVKESVNALNDGHLQFEEGFIQDFRTKEFARIDQLYENSVKSHTSQIDAVSYKPTRVVTKDAAGAVIKTEEVLEEIKIKKDVIDPKIAKALHDRKIELYNKVELNTIEWRKKQATIQRNAANAQKYLDGLKAYFSQKAETFEAMNEVSNGFITHMEKFLTPKGQDAKADTSAP